jgi:hypothetical protein
MEPDPQSVKGAPAGWDAEEYSHFPLGVMGVGEGGWDMGGEGVGGVGGGHWAYGEGAALLSIVKAALARV